MKKRLIFLILLATSSPLLPATTPAQQQLATRLIYLLLRGDKKQIEQLYKKPTASFSQSDGHALIHYETILTYFDNKQNYYYPNFKEMDAQRCFGSLYQKEVEENQKGRYTFIHGQKWIYEWLSSLYKALYEATINTQVPNYQFLRFKKPENLNKPKNDNCGYLWLNVALFGNTTCDTSCSAYYWLTNYDMSYPQKLTNEYIFNKFGLKKIYAKYQKHLEQLQQEHATLTNRGNLLLLSLSSQFAKENIIVQRGGNGHQSDPLSNIDLLKKSPERLSDSGGLTCTLTLTKKRTLKPSDEMRIFAFNGVEPDKWAAFCKKRDALFAQIKQDVRTLNSNRR